MQILLLSVQGRWVHSWIQSIANIRCSGPSTARHTVVFQRVTTLQFPSSKGPFPLSTVDSLSRPMDKVPCIPPRAGVSVWPQPNQLHLLLGFGTLSRVTQEQSGEEISTEFFQRLCSDGAWCCPCYGASGFTLVLPFGEPGSTTSLCDSGIWS